MQISSRRSACLAFAGICTATLLLLNAFSSRWIGLSPQQPALKSTSAHSPPRIVAPLHLRHLEHIDNDILGPLDEVYAVSAWLDTRPLLAHRQPELSLVAVMRGEPYIITADESAPRSPLYCHIRAKNRLSGTASSLTAPSRLTTLGDQHPYEVDLVTVMFSCQVDSELDWFMSDISVTLSSQKHSPPADMYLPVSTLPILDAVAHRTGRGYGAVCLPPLSSDLYAPTLTEYVAYYRSLGFTTFYAYMMDPGPATLDVARKLAKRKDVTFSPIRWALPAPWMRSHMIRNATVRKFRVQPDAWHLFNDEVLSPEREKGLGLANEGEGDVRLWYFGQAAAQQDCAFRAMHDGARFVANVDFDEYLAFTPTAGSTWSKASSRGSPLDRFVSWARSLEREWAGQRPRGQASVPHGLEPTRAEQLGVDVDKVAADLLPSAFVFQSAFACLKCRPEGAPPLTKSVEKAIRRRYGEMNWHNITLNSLPLALQSPVRADWIALPRRSKAIVDPWAWHSNVVHYPGISYADYATQHGPCSSTASRSVRSASDQACATALIETLGAGTHHVQPNDAILPDSTPGRSEHGRGAMYHVRGDRALSNEALNLDASPKRPPQTREEVVTAKSVTRVTTDQWAATYGANYGPYSGQLVEDWTLAALMTERLLELVEGVTS